jgi:hypothetical protein
MTSVRSLAEAAPAGVAASHPCRLGQPADRHDVLFNTFNPGRRSLDAPQARCGESPP